MKNFESINSYIINWSSHVKTFLHVNMLAINHRTIWSIWSMICNHSSSFLANRIRIRSRIINLMSLITSIDVIASIILKNNPSAFDRDQDQIIQMNRAFHMIEGKIISIERSYHIIRSSTIGRKNVASYAIKLIADQSIILERSEMHQKHNWKNVSTNRLINLIISKKKIEKNAFFNTSLNTSLITKTLILRPNSLTKWKHSLWKLTFRKHKSVTATFLQGKSWNESSQWNLSTEMSKEVFKNNTANRKNNKFNNLFKVNYVNNY